MCTEAAPERIEPPLRRALPARSTAGLQRQQHRQPLLRAAHAADLRQRREVAAAAQRAVVVSSRRSLLATPDISTWAQEQRQRRNIFIAS